MRLQRSVVYPARISTLKAGKLARLRLSTCRAVISLSASLAAPVGFLNRVFPSKSSWQRSRLPSAPLMRRNAERRPVELCAMRVSGFLCKITSSGRKMFIFQHQTNAGSRHNPVLGHYGELTRESGLIAGAGTANLGVPRAAPSSAKAAVHTTDAGMSFPLFVATGDRATVRPVVCLAICESANLRLTWETGKLDLGDRRVESAAGYADGKLLRSADLPSYAPSAVIL